MIQVQRTITTLVQVNGDDGWVVEGIQHHLLIIVGLAALDIVLPDHALLIETLAGNKQLVTVHEVLFKIVFKKKVITQVFTHCKDEITAGGSAGIEMFAFIGIQKSLECE